MARTNNPQSKVSELQQALESFLSDLRRKGAEDRTGRENSLLASGDVFAEQLSRYSRSPEGRYSGVDEQMVKMLDRYQAVLQCGDDGGAN
jgi:hypothetical protein